jgi:two-component system cell cycle sensor histidine kinase/response regulator CckA
MPLIVPIPSQTNPSETRAVEQNPRLQPELRRMAASLAHHLNNALTGIIGYLELSLREAPHNGPLQKHLTSSLQCVYQAAASVRRAMDFIFRPPAQRMGTRLSLREIAEWAAGETSPIKNADGSESSFSIVVKAESEGWINGNAQALFEVLKQLLANAKEAMPEGGAIRLCVWESSEGCHLSVTDEGIGLSQESSDHLFEPFMTTKGCQHLGLGLAICRELMEAQGGQILIASKLGQGTTVTITLPPIKETKGWNDSGIQGWQQQPAHSPKPPVSIMAQTIEAVI